MKLARKPVYIITAGEPGTSRYRILSAFTEYDMAKRYVECHPYIHCVIEIYDAKDGE